MQIDLKKKFRIYYNKVTKSIAFYPAIIAIGFLGLSWVMLEIDFSEQGRELKAKMSWLTLKDADTARSIISTIAGAILALTVFSFSMVMIVLNQAASQMSNRVLSSMIGNRFQQTVLGFYIGTIVYSLFLLSTIRDLSSGISVPALSIYLLIVLTVVAIFLFIYFLDYVTQTVKYETVIDRVQTQTMLVMEKTFTENKTAIVDWCSLPFIEITMRRSAYFQHFNDENLILLAQKHDLFFDFKHAKGTFVLKDIVILKVYSRNTIDKKLVSKIISEIDFFKGQPIDQNVIYGFKQLAEIAIKALSPGINDPGTAVLALQSLFDLFSFMLFHHFPQVLQDENKIARLFIPFPTFEELFKTCVYPIWNYGKTDQYIQVELRELILQIQLVDAANEHESLFLGVLHEIENQINL